MNNSDIQKEALLMLPRKLSAAVVRSASLCGGEFNEIRLRAGRPLFITCGGSNICCRVITSDSDIEFVLRALCGNSLYSHSETIVNGYISTGNGIRTGVCGRAVTDGGKIISVSDISSLCIRIPRRIYGASDYLYSLLASYSFNTGMMIYSLPGVGKTTALRELIYRLAGGDSPLRVAVIDTRQEIAGGLDDMLSVDILSGYPRRRGIEIALRTLSPQYIVCDEIGSEDDAVAIAEASSAGVPIIATSHAPDFDSLIKSEFMSLPHVASAFGVFVGLKGHNPKGQFETEVIKSITEEDIASV